MDIKTAAQEFERHLKVSRSPATVKAYGTALTHLENWVIIQGVEDVADINLGQFFSDLKEARSVSRRSMAAYMVAVSQFISFLHVDQIITDAQFAALKRKLDSLRGRTPDRKIPEVPEEAAFQAVLAQARVYTGGTPRQNMMYLRNIALLETLRSTGCRVAEVVSMKVKDLGTMSAIITGKGDRMRVVYFDAQAWSAIQDYLEARGSEPADPVFARHDRRAKGTLSMSKTSVRSMLDGLAVAAGVDPKTMTPHKFRHRFATKVLEGTGNLAVTQDLMGHANPATTRVYARLTDGKLALAHSGVAL